MIRNALFLCVVAALVFLFYLPPYVKMQDLHEKNHEYAKRISDLEHDNTRLEEERRRLIEDPAYFEKVAREKMGIIRDDEVIYKILGPGQKASGNTSEEASVIVKQSENDKEASVTKNSASPSTKTDQDVKKSSTAKTKSSAKKTTAAAAKKNSNSTSKKVIKKLAPKPDEASGE